MNFIKFGRVTFSTSLMALFLALAVLTGTQASFGMPNGGFTFGFDRGHEPFKIAQDKDGNPLPRPDILSVHPKSSNRGPNWKAMKESQIHFVAELLEFYPHAEIYFLSSQVQLDYDTARLATQGTIDEKRIHFLDLSLALLDDPKFDQYLEQRGLSDRAFLRGRSIVLVDGFNPMFANVVLSRFSPEARKLVRTQLKASDTFGFSSSRGSLVPVFQGEANLFATGGTLQASFRDQSEEIPRFTLQPQGLVSNNSVLRPKAFGQDDLGAYRNHDTPDAGTQINSREARAIMSDLRAEWLRSQTQEYFNSVRLLARQVRNFVDAKDRTSAIQRLIKLMSSSSEGIIAEAFVRDALEIRNLHGPRHRISLSDLRLERILPSDLALDLDASEFRFVRRYPHLAKFAEDVESHFDQLADIKNFKTIEELIRVESPDFVRTNVIVGLFESFYDSKARELIKQIIRKGRHHDLGVVAREYMNVADLDGDGLVFNLLVQSNDKVVLSHLARTSSIAGMGRKFFDEYLSRMLKTGHPDLVFEVLWELRRHPLDHDLNRLFPLAVRMATGKALPGLVELKLTGQSGKEITEAIQILGAKLRQWIANAKLGDLMNAERSFEAANIRTRELEVLAQAITIKDQQKRNEFFNAHNDVFKKGEAILSGHRHLQLVHLTSAPLKKQPLTCGELFNYRLTHK